MFRAADKAISSELIIVALRGRSSKGMRLMPVTIISFISGDLNVDSVSARVGVLKTAK